jgi:hypothetical protein
MHAQRGPSRRVLASLRSATPGEMWQSEPFTTSVLTRRGTPSRFGIDTSSRTGQHAAVESRNCVKVSFLNLRK